MSVISKKICMVGDFGVGKTSLVRRFLDRQFSDHYLSTIGVKISRKLIPVPTDQDLQLIIWDIEGKTQFQSITPHYLEGAMGAVIVADLNRPETIEHIQSHIQLLTSVNSSTIPCLVALNKVDTITKSGQERSVIAELEVHPQVVTVCQTSAKTGQCVDQMFESLAQRLLEHHHARTSERS
ncbi:MAG: GTP-binding protein [Aphanocapsa sp. GSE-SYN-MK-11-07L]|jgi:small GTP-binding protein|nr:GTP-binding protein [Aphanocapsa sp. GSE-SYN-MK-11-07L]